MGYQDQSQYGGFPAFSFNNSLLSQIIENAQAKKQRDMQQSSQMIGNALKLLKVGSQQNPDNAGPPPSDVTTPGYYYDPNSQVSIPSPTGYAQGGVVPGMTPDEINEILNARPDQWSDSVNEKIGDYRERVLGASPPKVTRSAAQYRTTSRDSDPSDLQGREREGGVITPEEMNQLWLARQRANELARASAMNEATQHYAQGGVVPLPDNAEGVLGWRTWPDPDSRADMGIKPDNPIQHFARGGVANSWSDPYGNEPLAAQEYTRNLTLPSVEGVAVANVHSRMQQQQLNQEQMQQALKASTDYLRQQQTDQIGQALLQNDPELSQDPRTRAMLQQGIPASKIYQTMSQVKAEEADANRQATNDWYLNQGRQASMYRQYGKGPYGEDLPQSANTPQTYTDENGREWRQGAGGHWYPMAPTKKPNPNQDTQQTFGKRFVNEDFNPDTVSIVPAQGSPAQQKLGTPDPTFDEPSTVLTGTNKKMALGTFQKGAGLYQQQAGANTGTAPPVFKQTTKAPVNTAVQVNTPEDADNLEPGTIYVTPDGKRYRR